MRFGIRVIDSNDKKLWLKSLDVDAFDGRGLVDWTELASEAMSFESVVDARNTYMRQSTVAPLRQDGQPNRPLTGLTIIIEPLA